MPVLLYIHGFLSSPESKKAKITEQWLTENHPDIAFVCPHLSSYPEQAKECLLAIVEKYESADIGVIGSSLGGFWATFLQESKYVNKSVLINPAVSPQSRFSEFVGKPLSSYYSDEVYTLGQEDLRMLIECDKSALSCVNDLWLMVQTGDEVLDYKLALEKYKNCKQTIEEGGDHSFKGYDRWLPNIVAYLFDR